MAMVARGEDDKRINDLFIKSCRIQIFTIFLVVTGFTLVGRSFVLWHTDGECLESYYIGLILMGASFIPITQTVAIAIVKAKDKFKFRAILLFCMAMLNVGISIPLAMFFGSVGSAAGTAFALIFANILIINIYYQKKCGIDMIRYWKNFLSVTVKFLPAIAVVAVLKFFFPVENILGTVLYGGLYVVLYCITAYFAAMNSFEKELIKKYAKRLLFIRK